MSFGPVTPEFMRLQCVYQGVNVNARSAMQNLVGISSGNSTR